VVYYCSAVYSIAAQISGQLAQLLELGTANLELGTIHQATLEQVAERQNVLISRFEQVVQFLAATDTYSCEQCLIEELGPVYGCLEEKARRYLLASEQVFRTRDFAAPSFIVIGIATAFERQVSLCLLSGLFAHLRRHGLHRLMPQPDWSDTDRTRPLFTESSKPEKFALGEIERLLRHPDPRIGGFFNERGLNIEFVRAALSDIVGPRNKAAHGRPIPFEEASETRNQWFTWRDLPGGVFAVLFPRP